MKLARRAMDDPERIQELEASFDDKVSELLAEANDAGYGSGEAMAALQKVVRNQAAISEHDPDPADDPADLLDRNGDPQPIGRRAVPIGRRAV